MPEKEFLELIFCPYEGNGVMHREKLNQYLEARNREYPPAPDLSLPLVIDRADFSKVTGIRGEEDMEYIREEAAKILKDNKKRQQEE